MRTDWEQDELISVWTLVEGDWDLVGEKVGAGRLGFALILKFYEIEGRFPAYLEEIPAAAVEYVASLVEVEPGLLAKYSWRSRTIERHRAQIRKRFGTRPATEDDEERLAQWLADKVCPVETNRDRLAGAARERCRSTSIEPPTSGQVERVVNSGCRRFEEAFAEQVMARPNRVCSVGGVAGAAARAGRVEVRPGAAEAGHAACGDREAGDGSLSGAG